MKNSKVTKSKELIEYEKDLKQSYDKAMKLYNDLTQIAERYKAGRNIDSDIQWFHSNFNLAGLTTYKKITLKLEPSKQEGIVTGVTSSIQNVQNMYTKNINREKEQAEKFTNTIKQIPNAVADFTKNYNDMKEANTIGADKYFHAKANSEAAQRGFLGKLTALFISNLREITDTFKNTLIKGMTLKDSLKDSKEDLEANKFGRTQGLNNPNKDSRELVDKYRPKGLPEKY